MYTYTMHITCTAYICTVSLVDMYYITCTTKVHVPSTVQLFAVNCTTYHMCTYYTYNI